MDVGFVQFTSRILLQISLLEEMVQVTNSMILGLLMN